MPIPIFPPGGDPGPSFSDLLRCLGVGPGDRPGASGTPGPPGYVFSAAVVPELVQATTVLALRYAGGIIMAGDRRATAGHSIAHRQVDKVHPADHWSGVAIAGSAGKAVEMVRLFQTELEHYEKVEGLALSLEGKANKLSQMVRANFGMAMQGLAVVPLFAGWDTRRRKGRIFTYDVTGGSYEEPDYAATGSGGQDARTTVKLAWREGLERDAAIELAISGLYEAADEDSATGGPDVVRGIYPTVATIGADGFVGVEAVEVARRFGALIEAKRARGTQP
ncbi:MAG: proteasome subunit beta [Acidimicrobiales bacterium]